MCVPALQIELLRKRNYSLIAEHVIHAFFSLLLFFFSSGTVEQLPVHGVRCKALGGSMFFFSVTSILQQNKVMLHPSGFIVEGFDSVLQEGKIKTKNSFWNDKSFKNDNMNHNFPIYQAFTLKIPWRSVWTKPKGHDLEGLCSSGAPDPPCIKEFTQLKRGNPTKINTRLWLNSRALPLYTG